VFPLPDTQIHTPATSTVPSLVGISH